VTKSTEIKLDLQIKPSFNRKAKSVTSEKSRLSVASRRSKMGEKISSSQNKNTIATKIESDILIDRRINSPS
jgi:hypothetical protein